MIDLDVMQDYIRDANPIPTVDDLDPAELAAFVTAAHTRRAAAMQAPTQHPTPASPVTPPPQQRRRKAWAFAAAFILIVVAVGIAALVTRDSDEAPVADEPMAPVTVTTSPPTTSAPDPIDVQSLTWSRVAHDEAVFNPTGEDVMWDVTVGGPGFVAVGESGVVEEDDSAVWVSEDGISWTLLPNGEPPLDGMFMWGVTAGGPGVVAVGADFDPDGPDSMRVVGGTMWASEDGISWSKTVVGGENSMIHDVTAGGPGLVAVGAAIPILGEPGLSRGAVWTSVDGMSWTRVPHDPDVFGDSEGLWTWGMEAVTVGGPGLVAIGGDTAEFAVEKAVWTSPDGLTWTLVPTTDIPGDGRMSDVVAGGPGLVAVGGDYLGAAAWTSPDGFTWTQVPPSQFTGSEAKLHSVISVGTQLVAVGGAEWKSEVWTSVDGLTWTQAEIPGVGGIHSVAATEDGLIAVGEAEGAAAVWTATQG